MRLVWILSAIVGLILFAVWYSVPPATHLETFTELDRNMLRIRSVVIALNSYANGHDGALPSDLHALAPDLITEDQLAENRYRDFVSKAPSDWLYLGANSKNLPDSAIIIASPATELCPHHLKHYRLVEQMDGVVKIITDEEFQQKRPAQK